MRRKLFLMSQVLGEPQDQQQMPLAIAQAPAGHGEGHDFWLTRNREGAGFWDGFWGEDGDTLTELAQEFPEVDVYVGDDGLLYG